MGRIGRSTLFYAAPQRHDRRDAEEAFEPVIEDAHPQAMADQLEGTV
jgi:hypothetical protein